MPITVNPGFVLLLAAPLMLALPRSLRPPALASAAFAALWLVLGRDFGVAGAVRQMGLDVVLLQLDALNQVFGIALLITLVLIAAYSSGRRNRFEDAAILTLAGGAVSALFAGDHLILFVAAASLAGLGATWVVFASAHEGSARAGVRLLVWHGLESLFFLVGAALHLVPAQGENVPARVDPTSLSGAFIFAALLIRVGAPFAHVWLKDAISRASPTGAAALSAFSTMLGVYALARFFPAEPLLLSIGAAMIALGALYAVAEDDLRSAAAYAQTASTGLCLVLIGIGSRLSLAAVEGHAFTIIIAFAALQMSLGCFVERWGAARASSLGGVARAAPIASLCFLVASLAVVGAPGFAMYPTLTAAMAAAAQWETRWLWLLFAGLSAVLFAALVLRPALLLHRQGPAPPAPAAPYGMLLGSVLGAFFCIAIGLAPHWLFALTPSELTLSPFALDRVARQLELLGGAGVAFLVMHGVGLMPRERAGALLDMDALYRGPVAGAGRWAGIVALRVFTAGQKGVDALWGMLGRWAGALMRQLDHPYRPRFAAVSELAALVAVVLAAALAGRL